MEDKQLGIGTDADGRRVTFWECYRPSTMGALGAVGLIIQARDIGGNRITHSDSIEGLMADGFILESKTAAEAGRLSEDVPAKRRPGRPRRVA